MKIELQTASAITFAGAQNHVPVIQEVRVVNDSDSPATDLTIAISSSAKFAAPLSLHIAQIAPRGESTFSSVEYPLDQEYLLGLSEAIRCNISAEVKHQGNVLASASAPIEVLAFDEWSGFRQLPELLAAFAQPNSKAVATILRSASELLLNSRKEPMSGYQAGDRQAVVRQISAIYSAIEALGIHYSNPPASFTGTGQKIRLPDRILEDKLATCLDLALLFVSCLEQAGLNPLILLEEGHAWVGCWLVDTTFGSSTNDDRQAMRKRIDAGEMIVLESTSITSHMRAGFSLAVKKGAERLGDEHAKKFDLAIDVGRSRRGQKILPLALSTRSPTDAGGADEGVKAPQIIEDIDLPPLAGGSVISETTAEPEKGISRIDHWRSKLLDLTLRNKLINFKPTKQTIPIYYPEPERLEDLLAEGKTFRIGSLPGLMGEGDPRNLAQHEKGTAAHLKEHLATDALKKNEVLAELLAKDLDNRLTEIFRAARTAQEEGGANTLFLVLGMLKWVESKDSSRSLLAPIVMVPVSLERKSVSSGFSFNRHDDETVVNPTLLQLLQRQFNLRIEGITDAAELPSDESGVDVGAIWARFRSAVVDIPGFEVVPTVSLGMFSFTKYLMWKDLTDRLEDVLASPLVRHLVGSSGNDPLPSGEFVHEARLDDTKHPNQLYLPVDCDSSQLSAVNAAADGVSFVLEGPPGTGKSQTITNIIADNLARGRTVLFVSEKVAALSVVHDRLKKIGLGPFLLELHSAKSSKADVLGQLGQALAAAGRQTNGDWEAQAQRLSGLRTHLNDYVRALHEVHPSGLSIFKATSEVVKHTQWTACNFDWANPDSHTREYLDDLRDVAQRLSQLGKEIKDLDRGALAPVLNPDWTKAWQEALLSDSRTLTSRIGANSESWASAMSATGLSALRADMRTQRNFSSLVSVLLQVRPEYISLLGEQDHLRSQSLLRSIAMHGRKRSELVAEVGVGYSEDILRLTPDDVGLAWRQASGSWWLKRIIGQFRVRGLLGAYSTSGTRPTVEAVPGLLGQLSAIRAEDEALRSVALDASRVLGGLWQESRTDWDRIDGAEAWLKSYADTTAILAAQDISMLQGIRAALAERISAFPAAFAAEGDIGSKLIACRAALDATLEAIDKVATTAGCAREDLVGEDARADVWDNLRHRMSVWGASAGSLRDWCLWQGARRDGLGKGLTYFIQSLEQGNTPVERAAEYFDFSYADWWLGKVSGRYPVLSQFRSVEHERKIKEFRDADARFAELTKLHVQATLSSRVPGSAMPPPGTPLAYLKRELQKRARHSPVRRLLSELSGVLPRITPCLLMSPLSVAQYLDASGAKFDLVIFDEASQIPTWDAIGAIARGKQVIVVGDPKQLPPTNFFNASENDDGAVTDDSEMVDDLESILDECIGAGLPTRSLKWHYRSRRESLIAFSNFRYYGSKLITFPSPETPDLGITYHHVPGHYARAGARTNRQEAEAVVKFIRQHFSIGSTPPKSLGVVTFSQPQQKLIEDLVDAARRNDKELDRNIAAQTSEPLFVKNLENVQGDERDIILFSICYGPDETGRMAMIFGPLNRDGGHRRLNVAITRAKEEVHIFATLKPEQLDLSRSKAAGVSDLKLYLEYAQRGPVALLAQASPTGGLPESPFEVEVLRFLQEKGWQVHPQVGCSSYRIDLGVVDPRASGRYLMAVECDGASYHSAATARDRDKLRQAVLEQLGWKVHRIWSTEWWTSPAREKNRVIEALEKAQSEEPNTLFAHAPIDPLVAPPINEVEQSTPAPMVTALSKALMYSESPNLRGNREAFLAPSEAPAVRQMVEQIIHHEGPVSDALIRKRIVSAYGFDRSGNRIQERIDALLQGRQGVTREDDREFYWPLSVSPGAWRGFRSGGNRDSLDIPIEELANAARAVLEEYVVADEGTLAKSMASIFGILRVSKQIQERMVAGIGRLESSDEIERVSGGFRLKG
ncbi:MAG: DUF3320 domain-containing protein [Pseudomonadota bacterium]